jgi:hypothetical protein
MHQSAPFASPLQIGIDMHAVLFIEQLFMEAYTQVEWAVNKILIQREW